MPRFFSGLLLAVFLLCGCSRTPLQTLKIGAATLQVELADTLPKQVKGLGGRESLASEQGMLFPFSSSQIADFWMKNMRFPLDFIWIRDNHVVGITPDVPAPTSTVLIHYLSPEPVDAVLEVNAGWAALHQVQEGDSVNLTSTP